MRESDGRQPPAADEALAGPLDELEAAILAKDNELRRMRAELELRNLYVAQLQAGLRALAGRIAALDERLCELEQRRAGGARRAAGASL